ncbi:hypothetical protein BD769DRAFT_1497758 [Suillus cothurnatus]|nr:hypothetical protein BD769DRAFT_1497758 [Suillus cothurnatus]
MTTYQRYIILSSSMATIVGSCLLIILFPAWMAQILAVTAILTGECTFFMLGFYPGVVTDSTRILLVNTTLACLIATTLVTSVIPVGPVGRFIGHALLSLNYYLFVMSTIVLSYTIYEGHPGMGANVSPRS